VTKFSLDDLEKSLAKRKSPNGTSKVAKGERRRGQKDPTRDVQGRLVAQECMRNGMDLGAAIQTILPHYKHPGGGSRVSQFLTTYGDQFAEELKTAVDIAGVDREQTLAFLYQCMMTSTLDFLDDDGNALPVKELKKLPRIMQCLIEEVNVATVEIPVTKGKEKIPVMSEDGKPLIIREQKVHVRIVKKTEAIDAMAKIMRWIGPTVVVNNNTTAFAVIMTAADERKKRLNDSYPALEG
jgi:hypothetical protein